MDLDLHVDIYEPRDFTKPGPAGCNMMSIVLWDMFTGSAPYREIFFRTLDPRFLGRFLWESARNAGKVGVPRQRRGQA
ncbi:MAG: hypothetical protein WAP47_11695 [Candidatus Rokuibacteriota bacterium]